MTEEIKAFKEKETYTPEDIRELVAILRSPDGCAWDREQTHKSVRNAMIEETYEFIEGLDKDDKTLMRKNSATFCFRCFSMHALPKKAASFRSMISRMRSARKWFCAIRTFSAM